MREDKIAKFYKKKYVLIPGGAGFIGSSLAKKLIGLGANVTIVDPFDPLCGANHFNIKLIRGEFTLINDRIEDYTIKSGIKRYDIIFNCVGLTNHHISYNNFEKDYNINCLSGLSLLKKMVRENARCRMISVGSRGQYGMSAGPRLIDESAPMNPIDLQAVHKMVLERYHDLFSANYNLDLSYIRLTNVYGPGQRLKGVGIGLIGEMLKNAVMGDDLVVYGSMTRIRDILFVDDVVNAMLLLGVEDKAHFAVYNLGGQACVLKELVDAITQKTGVKVKIVPFPGKIKKMDTGDVVLNTVKLTDTTGWSAGTSVRSGIAKTIDYYQANKKQYLGAR